MQKLVEGNSSRQTNTDSLRNSLSVSPRSLLLPPSILEIAAQTSRPLRLGILVPSSNTALEPLTSAIVSQLSPSVSVHYSRFTVLKISLEASILAQFDSNGPTLAAARLPADANVDVIGWSGTSGG
jgi:hypothetical protein